MNEELARNNVLLEDIGRKIGLLADAQAYANERLDRIEKRIEALEKRFDDFVIEMRCRLDRIESRLDHIESHPRLNGPIPMAKPTKTRRIPPKFRKKL